MSYCNKCNLQIRDAYQHVTNAHADEITDEDSILRFIEEWIDEELEQMQSAKCKECEDVYCKDCLNEDGICKTCEEERKENSNEEQENKTEKQQTCAAVQPDGVGQTIVHA